MISRNKRIGVWLFGYLAILYFVLDLPNAVINVFGALLATIFVVFQKFGKIRFPFYALLLSAFCFSYFYYDTYTGFTLSWKIAYGYSIIIMFLLGCNWGNSNDGQKNTRQYERAIDIAYYSMAAFIIACVFFTYIKGYRFTALFRTPVIIWDNSFGNSTHFATMSSVPLAIGLYKAIVIPKGEKKLHLLIVVLMVTANILMSNRVVILFLAVFLILAIFLKYRGGKWNKSIISIVGILTLIIIAYVFYSLNAFNIQTTVLRIPIFSRIQLLEEMGYSDPRLERQIYVITHFFEHLSGGGYFAKVNGDAHNVFINVYDYAGIIPFAFFMLFTIKLWHVTWRMFINSDKDRLFGLFSLLIVAYTIAFFEEPVFRSTPSFMVSYFAFAGLVMEYYKNSKDLKDT